MSLKKLLASRLNHNPKTLDITVPARIDPATNQPVEGYDAVTLTFRVPASTEVADYIWDNHGKSAIGGFAEILARCLINGNELFTDSEVLRHCESFDREIVPPEYVLGHYFDGEEILYMAKKLIDASGAKLDESMDRIIAETLKNYIERAFPKSPSQPTCSQNTDGCCPK